MKNKMQFRQGDVLIERVSRLPKKPRKSKTETRVILAHGEVTGHAHEIETPRIAALEECEAAVAAGDLSDASTMTNAAMELQEDTAVVHQEHGRIALPKGNYIVRRQREYHPEELRNVAD
jgi:hypothetical protein